MIKSGRNVPTPAIPIPDFAVPYAAPIPNKHQPSSVASLVWFLHPKVIAKAMPACRSYQYNVLTSKKLDLLTIPKNGANFGV
jgi:hypothetical protein